MNAAGMIVRVGDAVSRQVVAVYADGAEAEGVTAFCGPPFVGDGATYDGWVEQRVYADADGTWTGDTVCRLCKVRVEWGEA
jgi:hypothetical protein